MASLCQPQLFPRLRPVQAGKFAVAVDVVCGGMSPGVRQRHAMSGRRLQRGRANLLRTSRSELRSHARTLSTGQPVRRLSAMPAR